MKMAIEQAKIAQYAGEVPVGAEEWTDEEELGLQYQIFEEDGFSECSKTPQSLGGGESRPHMRTVGCL